jgi:tetratricopeptide (TPR) repeat protein
MGLLDESGSRLPPLNPGPGEIQELLDAFRRHRTPFHAANLVDAAIVLGKPEIGADAAQFLVDNPIDPLLHVDATSFVLGIGAVTGSIDAPMRVDVDNRHRRIAQARGALRLEPRNPILLVDLARDYSSLGQSDKAERALRQALALAPNNRFVLRSSSRFLLHEHRPDEAHTILRHSSRTSDDPWLLAAEIVSADAADRVSRWLKKGQQLISDSAFHPREISELASAIGTIEFANGSKKNVRRLFEQALLDPTENAVAQAQWLSRHMDSFEVPDGKQAVLRAFEAEAWSSAVSGNYRDAIEKARKWLRDEPFASRPAIFGSWVAHTALTDYADAEDLVTEARIANPHDPSIIAQLVYCIASLGRVDEAEKLLRLLPDAINKDSQAAKDTTWPIVLEADEGLIAFRKGLIEKGREHYLRAIRRATELGKKDVAAVALLNLAREEMVANPHAVLPMVEIRRALAAFHSSIRPLYERFVDQLLPQGTVTEQVTSARRPEQPLLGRRIPKDSMMFPLFTSRGIETALKVLLALVIALAAVLYLVNSL